MSVAVDASSSSSVSLTASQATSARAETTEARRVERSDGNFLQLLTRYRRTEDRAAVSVAALRATPSSPARLAEGAAALTASSAARERLFAARQAAAAASGAASSSSSSSVLTLDALVASAAAAANADRLARRAVAESNDAFLASLASQAAGGRSAASAVSASSVSVAAGHSAVGSSSRLHTMVTRAQRTAHGAVRAASLAVSDSSMVDVDASAATAAAGGSSSLGSAAGGSSALTSSAGGSGSGLSFADSAVFTAETSDDDEDWAPGRDEEDDEDDGAAGGGNGDDDDEPDDTPDPPRPGSDAFDPDPWASDDDEAPWQDWRDSTLQVLGRSAFLAFVRANPEHCLNEHLIAAEAVAVAAAKRARRNPAAVQTAADDAIIAAETSGPLPGSKRNKGAAASSSSRKRVRLTLSPNGGASLQSVGNTRATAILLGDSPVQGVGGAAAAGASTAAAAASSVKVEAGASASVKAEDSSESAAAAAASGPADHSPFWHRAPPPVLTAGRQLTGAAAFASNADADDADDAAAVRAAISASLDTLDESGDIDLTGGCSARGGSAAASSSSGPSGEHRCHLLRARTCSTAWWCDLCDRAHAALAPVTHVTCPSHHLHVCKHCIEWLHGVESYQIHTTTQAPPLDLDEFDRPVLSPQLTEVLLRNTARSKKSQDRWVCDAVAFVRAYSPSHGIYGLFVLVNYFSSARGKFISRGFLDDSEFSKPEWFPALSIRFAANLGGLEHKTLTCTRCGPAVYACYFCPDPACHYGLCLQCWSASRHGPNAPVQHGLPDDTRLLLPAATCAACIPHGPLAGEVDSSVVQLPFIHVRVNGLAAAEQKGQNLLAAEYRKAQAFSDGIGCYPYSFGTPSFGLAAFRAHAEALGPSLALVTASVLVVEISAHGVASHGYQLSRAVVSARQLLDGVIRPLVSAFRQSHGRPADAVAAVLLNCCDVDPQLWAALMRDLPPSEHFFLLSFRRPLLLADTPSVMANFTRVLTNYALVGPDKAAYTVQHCLASTITYVFEQGSQPMIVVAGQDPITTFHRPFSSMLYGGFAPPQVGAPLPPAAALAACAPPPPVPAVPAGAALADALAAADARAAAVSPPPGSAAFDPAVGLPPVTLRERGQTVLARIRAMTPDERIAAGVDAVDSPHALASSLDVLCFSLFGGRPFDRFHTAAGTFTTGSFRTDHWIFASGLYRWRLKPKAPLLPPILPLLSTAAASASASASAAAASSSSPFASPVFPASSAPPAPTLRNFVSVHSFSPSPQSITLTNQLSAGAAAASVSGATSAGSVATSAVASASALAASSAVHAAASTSSSSLSLQQVTTAVTPLPPRPDSPDRPSRMQLED